MRLNFLTAIRAGATRRRPASVKLTLGAIAWLVALAALLLPAARGDDLPWCPPPTLDELWPCDEATVELPESAPCAAFKMTNPRSAWSSAMA